MSQLTFILCACVNFTILLCVSAQIYESTNDNNNSNYYLPAYAIAAASSGLLNLTLCEKELLNFRDAVDQRILWSLRVLDSSGEFQSGFLYGNNYWLGSRSQCFDTMNTASLQISKRHLLNNTLYRDPQKEIPPFKVNYFIAHFKHNSTLQYHVNLANEDVMTLGLCLPSSCSENDISFILEKIFRDRILLISDLYSADFKLIQVKNLKDNYEWLTSGAIPFICVILLLSIFMVTIGTIYDIFINRKYSNKKSKINNNGKTLIQEIEIETASSLKKSRIGKILLCFSVVTNTKVIFNTKLHADTLPVIHGLKFLSMCWLILGHTTIYMVDHIDNKVWSWKFMTNAIFINSPIPVETFFFLSGLLVTYFYIKDKMDKDRNQLFTYRAKINEFFVLVIKRYIRLTPTYIAVLAIAQLYSTWFDKTSLFFISERPHETCSKYWWRNLLYINNLFSFKTMCMSWTWYISADMQFFVIGIALLILSTAYFYTVAFMLGALLISSIVLAGYSSYVYEFVPTLDEQYRLLGELYFPPWIRMSPYIVGIITGYILTQLNGKLILKKRTVILCWCFGSACNFITLFSLYDRTKTSILASAIYMSLYRVLWAVGMAWIVIACLTRHGGIIYQFLSFKGWAPFSRLSYGAYLLNPIIIRWFRLQSEKSIHFEFLSVITLSIANFVMIYICSYVLSLIVEAPYILLMRKIIQTRSRRKSKWRNNEIVILHTKL
ncbi:LOW QUALITY PROTEIN: nose resistant to fluoxetine protein 6-like [Mycetomoellerius zeteki]|uniref:LOW QUALITY PROTEIN: nose resistant to fluoxetine protein 6-like n=1 Tax=Mycetomoellerius zeteki TaxID=64791 RepID=UPI00084EBA78|nr:PREDICTED: LOW QUALITY PROTEIN: nose resistant to fluoxetine protein 6-like [Trachymyrmex zeteki]